MLQTPEAAIVTDPFISADINCQRPVHPTTTCPTIIDLVVITHGHQDHIVLETLLQLRGRVGAFVVPRSSRGNLCDPSIGLYLKHLGFPVIEVDDFDEVPFPGGKVTATPFLGEHADLDIRGKSTYWVELAGKKVFVGADSSGIDPTLYRYVRNHLGTADMAFLGMECDGAPLTWLYQALLTRPGHQEDERLAQALRLQRRSRPGRSSPSSARARRTSTRWVRRTGSATSWPPATPTTRTSSSRSRSSSTWCADNGVKAEHLLGKREWRW